MILKMEKLSAFGLLSDRDALVRALMRKRCAQIRPLENLEHYEELQALTESCSSEVYQLEQQQGRYSAALTGIAPYVLKTGLFPKKPEVLYEGLEDENMLAAGQALCTEIEGILSKISDLRAQRNKDQFLRTSLEPWASDALPLEETGTRTTLLSRFLIPLKTNLAVLDARVQELAPASCTQEVSADREQRYVLAVCHREQEEELWQALSEFGANRISFPGMTGTVAAAITACDERIRETEMHIETLEQQLREIGKDTFPLKYSYDVLQVQIQRQRTGGDMRSTRETFFFSAWVPETTRDQVIGILEKFGCYYQLQECAVDDEEAPILLKNSKLVAPFESITSMYALPSYGGFDPNPFIAPFFFIFFGMMLSDAGYGLLLVLGGLVLLKLKGAKPGEGKLLKVIILGGVSTVIWGAIYGSWFGDIIEVVAHTFFGVELKIPFLMDPMEDAVTIMVLSMALGVVHIMVGMGIKAYMMIRRGHPWEALFDVGFWYLIFIGIFMLLVESLFTVGAAIAVAGAVGLILTQGRDKKNPIMKLLGGIMSLYDVTGYFSDILSYTRIVALGLATGVIASVVNTLGAMVGGGIGGAIVLIVVFLFGHALNLAINALGAYVHTSRLQYVEFFGKFYESGGQPFMPLAADTRYISILDKEEI